jgi:hypothetical protein
MAGVRQLASILPLRRAIAAAACGVGWTGARARQGYREKDANELSEVSHAIGPATPRLRRGLAVALRAKAEARRRSGARERV